MEKFPEDAKYQRKDKENETSSDLESEHNQDNSHIGDGRSAPSEVVTPRTDLIESESSSSVLIST